MALLTYIELVNVIVLVFFRRYSRSRSGSPKPASRSYHRSARYITVMVYIILCIKRASNLYLLKKTSFFILEDSLKDLLKYRKMATSSNISTFKNRHLSFYLSVFFTIFTFVHFQPIPDVQPSPSRWKPRRANRLEMCRSLRVEFVHN